MRYLIIILLFFMVSCKNSKVNNVVDKIDIVKWDSLTLSAINIKYDLSRYNFVNDSIKGRIIYGIEYSSIHNLIKRSLSYRKLLLKSIKINIRSSIIEIEEAFNETGYTYLILDKNKNYYQINIQRNEGFCRILPYEDYLYGLEFDKKHKHDYARTYWQGNYRIKTKFWFENNEVKYDIIEFRFDGYIEPNEFKPVPVKSSEVPNQSKD